MRFWDVVINYKVGLGLGVILIVMFVLVGKLFYIFFWIEVDFYEYEFVVMEVEFVVGLKVLIMIFIGVVKEYVVWNMEVCFVVIVGKFEVIEQKLDEVVLVVYGEYKMVVLEIGELLVLIFSVFEEFGIF